MTATGSLLVRADDSESDSGPRAESMPVTVPLARAVAVPTLNASAAGNHDAPPASGPADSESHSPPAARADSWACPARARSDSESDCDLPAEEPASEPELRLPLTRNLSELATGSVGLRLSGNQPHS